MTHQRTPAEIVRTMMFGVSSSLVAKALRSSVAPFISRELMPHVLMFGAIVRFSTNDPTFTRERLLEVAGGWWDATEHARASAARPAEPGR